ncbi:uncharacterized protein (TIGR04255 family) [Paraburkholderia sp. UCT70]|uniref:TIGR04255 family protein n=1 Tax=Paraburkholderia sp. UCT70 TaxID=2991068 RepID=UPI003D195688
MGTKMKHAPVYFTIAQVRHNPILQLERFVPDIQESMRRAGFPDHRPSNTLVINLTPVDGDPGAPRPIPTATLRHAFLSMDGTRGFILEQNSLSFQTTEYDTFQTFSEQFFTGLEIVHSCLSLAYSERVGIRYLDAVVPKGGEAELAKYLAPGVVGLMGRLPEDVPIGLSLSETHIPMPDANLLSRTIIRNGPLGFPFDLQPQGLQVPPRFQQVNGVHAIIDTDASRDGREPFSLTELRKRLNTLHSRIRMAFEATVTDYALKAWQ